MHRRYAAMAFAEIMALPQPSNVLYAWTQSGGRKVRAFLKKATISDADFIAFMHHAYNRSSGRYRAIEREAFKAFMDYNRARARIVTLAGSDGEFRHDA